ncbi:hypothetical protein HR060_00785 [Catenovulum sp. SM1970]|uniref:hypothetical protein n=1 Tax=Marinifaba aquimaris TaxID=2741323 RepID=UPI001573831C|nr:hypothetical protein [Marinifaba aquimaris]NTS75385.1 hypothetical protein [Marinifaba aquimaris]
MKKNIELDSKFTLDFLKSNTLSIEELLNKAEYSEQDLFSLIEERDDLIENYIKSNEVPDRHFLEQELSNNEKLLTILKPLLKQTEKQLHHFVRGRKAVKNYK